MDIRFMLSLRGGAEGKDLTSITCLRAAVMLLTSLPVMLRCPASCTKGPGDTADYWGAGDSTGQGSLLMLTWTI